MSTSVCTLGYPPLPVSGYSRAPWGDSVCAPGEQSLLARARWGEANAGPASAQVPARTAIVAATGTIRALGNTACATALLSTPCPLLVGVTPGYSSRKRTPDPSRRTPQGNNFCPRPGREVLLTPAHADGGV